MPGPQGLTLRPTSQESVGPHRRVPGLALHCRHELQKRPLQHSAPSVPGGRARIVAGGSRRLGTFLKANLLCPHTPATVPGSGGAAARERFHLGEPCFQVTRGQGQDARTWGRFTSRRTQSLGRPSPPRGEGWGGLRAATRSREAGGDLHGGQS